MQVIEPKDYPASLNNKRIKNYRKTLIAIVLVIMCISPQINVECMQEENSCNNELNYGISTYLQDVRVGDSKLNIGFYLEDPCDNHTLIENQSYSLLAWAEDAEITSYPGRYISWPSVTILIGWEDPENHVTKDVNLGKIGNTNIIVDNGDWGANRIENELSIILPQFDELEPDESIPNAWFAVRFSLSEYRGLTNLDPHEDFDCNVSLHLHGKRETLSDELAKLVMAIVIIFGGLAGVLLLLRLTKKR